MAGDLAPNQDLPTAPANDAEKEVLDTVPPDASADDAALASQIDSIAGGILGGDINDPRYQPKGTTDDTTTTGTDGGGGTITDPAAATTDAGTSAPVTPPAPPTPPVVPPAASDTSLKPEDAPKVEAKDYSLTVKAADTVDAEGKTVPGKEYKITSLDDLPDDFVPTSNKQALQIINDMNRLEAERRTDEATTEAQRLVDEGKASQQAQLNAWEREIESLQTAKVLGVPKLKPGEAGYNDDPVTKEVSTVFEYMMKINKERADAGNPNRLSSFIDAYNLMQVDKTKVDQAAKAKEEAETAKLKAGTTAGTQTRATGAATASVYRAGQAQEITDLL